MTDNVKEEAVEAEVANDTSENTEKIEETTEKQEKKKQKKSDAALAEKEKELAEANDKYMRLFAEYENFRRRTAKEKESIYADAYIDALTQILPVLDNLERAAAYGGGDAESLSKVLPIASISQTPIFASVSEKLLRVNSSPFESDSASPPP